MTIAEQLNAVNAVLKPWAEDFGGTAEVAGDPFHLFAMLGLKPGSVRAVVLFAGEVKRGEFEESGIADRNFAVVITRGRGLTLEPGAPLVTGGAGADQPLFALVEQARDLIRAMSFTADETEVTPNYLGCEIFPTPEGRPADAYQLNFSIGVQLPDADPETP